MLLKLFIFPFGAVNEYYFYLVLLEQHNVRIVMLLNVNTVLWCCDLIWLMGPSVSSDNKLTKIKKGGLVLLMN